MSNPKMNLILEGLSSVNERQKSNAHKRQVKHNAEEIEKERKAQGAPKDAEYDAESGYFLKPGEEDIYWSSKNKAYTLKWDGKDYVDEATSTEPFWDVRYTYEGDSLSPYETNIWVQAKDGKTAVKRAEKYLKEKNRVKGPEVWNFRLDSSKPVSDDRLNNKLSNIERLPL